MIDLSSDTATRPSDAMKKAMCAALLGDEQRGEDPTTNLLQERVAHLLGHETALFVPSATMANEIAIQLLCPRGQELMAYEHCHLFTAEAGAPAALAGAMIRSIRTPNGIFTAQDVEDTYRFIQSPLYPTSRMISVENTTNFGGGVAWSLPQLKEIVDVAARLNLSTHMDGARLFHAVTKTGHSAKEIASPFHLVTLCLSKGLGCPAGALLVMPQALWKDARRLKQQMGGSLRQSGMLAAAGLYALENNINRLEEDHLNAAQLAKGLQQIPHIQLCAQPQTNIVFFLWEHPTCSVDTFMQKCAASGVRFSLMGKNKLRAVTHLDVSSSDIQKAINIVEQVATQTYA